MISSCHKINSPTRSLSKNYVVWMIQRISLDKLNASKVFPMSHGLFKQSFVGATKISINLIGNYSEIPNSILFSSCSSGNSFSAQSFDPESLIY